MRLLATTAALLFALTCACSATEPAATMRVRLEWGGGKPRTWRGLLEIERGRFENPQPLGVEADLPGSAWADESALRIRRRSKRRYDGIDATVTAAPDARLRVTLQSADEPPLRTSFSLPLRDLADGHRALRIGDAGDRLSLRRTPGDSLRLLTERPHLVFDPGESFDCRIEVDPWTRSIEPRTGRLLWRLWPAGADGAVLAEGAQLLTISPTGQAPTTVPLRLTLPKSPGVYELDLEMLSRSVRRVRRIQLVVADRSPRPADEPTKPTNAAAARLVDLVEPTVAHQTRRLHRRSGLRSLRGHVDAVSRMFSTDSSNRSDEPEWIAFELEVEDESRPHRLVVELNAERPRTVGISVLQPNALGHLVPNGIDSGVRIPPPSPTNVEADRTVQHVVRFQPRTSRPVVLLHSKDGRIDVRRIELQEETLATPRPLPPVDRTASTWLVGPLVERPTLPATFGVGQRLDEPARRSLDDWRTFESAIDGFVDHLHHTSSNAALVCVLTDGSAVFPCPELEPTARFDCGTQFSTGQDPVRKDVLELLLRRCDREGLVLLPMLRFNAPIPSLEAMRRNADRSDETHRAVKVESVEASAVRDDDALPGEWNGYDPLDPDVQEAVLGAVATFARRYADHPSLGAVVIDVGSDTFLVPKPSPDGVPLGDGDRIAEFHGRLAEAVMSERADLRCVLLHDAAAAAPRTPATGWPERTSLLRRARPSRAQVDGDVRPRGAVQSTASTPTRLPSFDAVSPWQPAHTWLAARTTEVAARARRPSVAAVAAGRGMVFVGGDACPPVLQPEVREIRGRIASLPTANFKEIPDVPQPVLVRRAVVEGRTWFVVVNDFPYAVDVRLRTRTREELPAARTIERVRFDDTDLDVNGESTIPLTLEPFDFHGFSVDSPEVVVESVEVEPSPAALVELRRRLRELDAVIAGVRSGVAPQDAELENPEFEQAPVGKGDVPGWTVDAAGRASAEIDTVVTHAGERALRLSAGEQSTVTALTTVPFDGESRAVVSAWLRATGEETQVRFVFETSVRGRERRRFASVAVTPEWKRHSFRVSDVVIGADDRGRIGFELSGEGRLHVDDVSVRLVRVTAERVRSLEKTFAAASLALDEGRLSDARRLLEGEWTRDPSLQRFRSDEPATPTDRPREPSPPADSTESRSWWRLLRRPRESR